MSKIKFGIGALQAAQENYQIILDKLIRGYQKIMKKDPEGLDLIKIKQEAKQRAEDSAKVVDMEGRTLNPDKPIMGGTQDFGEDIRKIYDEAKGPGKGDEMVEALKSPGARKSTEIIEKQIQETFPDIKLFGDETFEEILEIQRTGKHPRMKADGGRIGFANGGENIIGKNLDNITNVAKGLDKEMLDMTFDDKYYRDVIQPAKLGQAPIPSRMEMMLKSKPFTAMGIGMRPGTFGERAQPTKAASQFLNTLGKGAKFVGTKVGPLSFMDLFASTPLGADDEVTDEMRQSIEVTPTSPVRADYERAPNAAFAELLAESATADDAFEEALAEATRKGQRQSFLSQVADYLPFGSKSLTGNIARGVGSMFRNIAPASYGTSGRAFNALTPQGKAAVGSIYGQGGIMQGYNPVSAFGRGPIGAIDNRIANIANRRAPQTAASQQKMKDLFAAREKIMQTTLDSDSQYTGPKSSPRGQKAGVMDDDPFGGTSGTTGGSSKIVCTMMNESYGFGNFRNKIWLRHSRDLPKEYEIGYHTIFLPLVKFAKGKGKLNKVVKKTLEHIARHRTLDLKQEMKGKTHTLGRVYRKILEPICLMVGKIKTRKR